MPPRFSPTALLLPLAGAALLASAISTAVAEEVLPGPVEAQVVHVIDGDTFVADARIWPGQTITVSVRIRGIDAPELRSRCDVEKAAANRSRAALEQLIGGTTVLISNVGGDKYYGRVVADVATAREEPVAESLLTHALARAYGGGKRSGYCG